MTFEIPGLGQNSGTFTVLSDDEESQNSVRILKVSLCWNRSILDIFLIIPEFCFNHHHHISVMELGHLLTRSGLMYSEASSKVCRGSFCQLGNSVSLSCFNKYEIIDRNQCDLNKNQRLCHSVWYCALCKSFLTL
jgi:hypothetical protein